MMDVPRLYGCVLEVMEKEKGWSLWCPWNLVHSEGENIMKYSIARGGQF